MTLTSDQIAAALGRSTRYVLEHLAADGVPHVGVQGALGRPKYTYEVEELRRWVDTRKALEAEKWAALEALLRGNG